jgi:DNA mismatch repair protein MutH
MTSKKKAAVIGSGNIGTDLLIKLLRTSDVLEPLLLVGIEAGSEGLERARRLGVDATHDGIDGLLRHPRFDDVDDLASGVEVKTLPFGFNRAGRARVRQSTFLTSASLTSLAAERWDTSRVKKKLTRVLFLPIDVDSARIGTAFLYEPNDVDIAAFRADWEDLADLVARGLGFAITARRGRLLQLRPKAKNATVTMQATTVDGDDIVLRPQGFYVRRVLTQRLIDDRFPPSSSAVLRSRGRCG